MNISDCTNDIKVLLGLQTVALPFKQPPETVIAEIIKTSIRTFSRIKPWERECIESRKNLIERTPGSGEFGIYILPSQITTTEVISAYAEQASSRLQDGTAATNTFTVASPFIGFGSYYPTDIMNAQLTGAAVNKYAGITSTASTSKWLGHNTIQLFDVPRDVTLKFVAKCYHDLSGETIPESQVESFMRLAKLDVQTSLYNTIKNMTNVGSAYKDIQLKIDEWSGAEKERDQLVDTWTEKFHLDEIQELVQFF